MAYRQCILSEPAGFTTHWPISEISEYQGVFEFTPRSARARLAAKENDPQMVCNCLVDVLEQAKVYKVNDNNGAQFLFEKELGSHRWFTAAAVDQARSDLSKEAADTIAPMRSDASVDRETRSLAATCVTDVLTATFLVLPTGLCLDPSKIEARAAWYSLGFLLRRAAAVRLDVAEHELEVGIQPVVDIDSDTQRLKARIFMSDTLENGAGYSNHLGQPSEFEDLLRFILANDAASDLSFIGPLVAPDHQDACATSCHRCLREYGNMAYHPLLDWRLGIDMVRLALDADASIDLTAGYWSKLAVEYARVYFEDLELEYRQFGPVPGGVDPTTKEVTLLGHPLWETHKDRLCTAAAEAWVFAEQSGLKPKYHSLFRALRFPYQ